MTDWRSKGLAKPKRIFPIKVWLKHRQNPAKKDGTRTVSYTLQWTGEDGADCYHSLGAGITEEEAEKQRTEFELRLNFSVISHDVLTDPEIEVLRLRKEAPEDYETLVLAFGEDPRKWAMWEVPVHESGKVVPWRYDFLRAVAKALRGESETDIPSFVRFRLGWHHPDAHKQLLMHFGSHDAFDADVQERLKTHFTDETPSAKPVIDELLKLAEETAWSKDRLEEQFRERHPEEYEKLVSEGFPFAQAIERISMPPDEMAKHLLRYAQTGETKEDETKMPRPKVFWDASETVERRGKHGGQAYEGDTESVGNELDFGEQLEE